MIKSNTKLFVIQTKDSFFQEISFLKYAKIMKVYIHIKIIVFYMARDISIKI
jgi:hypothetical protein